MTMTKEQALIKIKELRDAIKESPYEDYLKENGMTSNDLTTFQVLEWNKDDLLSIMYIEDWKENEDIKLHNELCKVLDFEEQAIKKKELK